MAWKVIEPNYLFLLQTSDSINEEKKEALLKHAKEFKEMIEDAKKLVGLNGENK